MSAGGGPRAGNGAVREIRRRLEQVRPGRPGVRIVAVDGHSGSGKSTLAAGLADHPDTTIVAGDDFYADLADRERRNLSAAEGVDRYFDWRRLRSDALEPLAAGRDAVYQPFDWERGGGLGDAVVVPSAPVVVVEGVYSARAELADLVDLTVLLTAPAAIRMGRLRLRGHDHDGMEERWEAAELVYFSRIRPPESFDLVVRGS